REVVVQPPVHHRALIGQVEGVRVPEEYAAERGRRPDGRREVDLGLRPLRAADREVVERETGNGRPVPDAGERLTHLAPADATAARREVRRLARLAVLVAADAGPGAERGVVDLAERAGEQIQDQVVALRILAEDLGVPGEAPVRIEAPVREVAHRDLELRG